MAFKCLVLGCENKADQGITIGLVCLCAPCHDMLCTGKPNKGLNWVSKLARQCDEYHSVLKTIERTAASCTDLRP